MYIRYFSDSSYLMGFIVVKTAPAALCKCCIPIESNLHYTRHTGITPKRATSGGRGISATQRAWATQKHRSSDEPLATVYYSTGPGIEPKIYRADSYVLSTTLTKFSFLLFNVFD